MKTIKDIVISTSEPPVNNVGWIKPLSNGTFMLYFFGDKGWTTSSMEIPEALKAEIARLDETDNEIKENLAAETIRAKAAEQANAQAITDEAAERTKEVDELTNQLYEAYKVYGIEFDTAISSPTCFRIGNLDLHRSLPIQSKMRGCLLDDDGNVVEYLDPNDWNSNVKDGSKGQVMVEIPTHYRKFEKEGTKCRVLLSELPLMGYHKVPKCYVSAYEATVERSTQKLCSVVNYGEDYRGGNNNADWDGTYKSLLGLPATSISLNDFRAKARNRGSVEWNCYLYQVHETLFWLFVVEYATLNSQAAFNAELTSEGYRQGGLGDGVTTWDWDSWSTHNGNNPIIPCGVTNSLGNHSGTVDYSVHGEDNAVKKTFSVPRYRGVENPFGHIWKWTDGIKIINQSEAAGGLSKMYICDDPSKFTNSGVVNYEYRGDIARKDGFVKQLILGEDGDIMPLAVGAGSTTYFCDYFYTNIPESGESERGVLFGGSANGGAYAGFVYANTNNAPTYAGASIGSRLCFIPSEA